MMSRENLHTLVAKERAKRELKMALQMGFEAFENEVKIKVIAKEIGFPVDLIKLAAKQGNYKGLETLAVQAVEAKTIELAKFFLDYYNDEGWVFSDYAKIDCPEYILIKSSNYFTVFDICEETELQDIERVLLNLTDYEREQFYLVKQGEIQHFEVKLDNNFKPYIIYLSNRNDEGNEYRVLKRGIKKKVKKPRKKREILKLTDEEIDFMFS